MPQSDVLQTFSSIFDICGLHTLLSSYKALIARKVNILEIGMEIGIEQGIEQGENRLGLLNKKLLEENRLDDLKQGLEDVEYRKKLYREYQI